MNEQNEFEIDLAIRRILLIHGIAMSYGGIPLIYLNDEIGALNDYSFRDDPAKVGDSRWVHRPDANWQNYALRDVKNSIQSRIYLELLHMIQVRKTQPALATNVESVETGNPHVLGFAHFHETGPLLGPETSVNTRRQSPLKHYTARA